MRCTHKPIHDGDEIRTLAGTTHFEWSTADFPSGGNLPVDQPLHGRESSAKWLNVLLMAILVAAVVGYIVWKEMLPQEALAVNTAAAQHSSKSEPFLFEFEVNQYPSTTLVVPHHTQRLYQWQQDELVPITPEASFWGEPKSLETTYFRIEYPAIDAPTVERWAPSLNGFYESLYKTVGLPLPTMHRPITIQILPQGSRRPKTSDSLSRPTSISVFSPALASIPRGMTEADLLQRTIGYNLAEMVLMRKVGPESELVWWHTPAYHGVVGWLLDPEADDPIVTFHQLALHQTKELWLAQEPTPTLADIPVQLAEDEVGSSIHWSPNHYISNLEHQALINQLLIHYALTTYGEDHLPTLIESIAQHDSWVEIVPHVFGIPAQQFEADWAHHMQFRNQR